MTWKEFKDAVAAKGVQDDDEIFYIDTGTYPYLSELIIHKGEEGVSISA